jgi:hypothetical protein
MAHDWECNTCGAKPCNNRTFCAACRAADFRMRGLAKNAPKISKPGFPRSTLDATKWLIVYHPERLQQWLERHEPGLETAAKEEMQK